jgi:hypothetical protein
LLVPAISVLLKYCINDSHLFASLIYVFSV